MQMFAPNFSNQFAYLQWKFDLVFVANFYFYFFEVQPLHYRHDFRNVQFIFRISYIKSRWSVAESTITVTVGKAVCAYLITQIPVQISLWYLQGNTEEEEEESHPLSNAILLFTLKIDYGIGYVYPEGPLEAKK